MKQRKFVYFLVIFVVISLFYLNNRYFSKLTILDEVSASLSDDHVIGILNRNISGLHLDTIPLQHYSIKINADNSSEHISDKLKEISSNSPLLITIETEAEGLYPLSSNVLEDIIKGNYDIQFNAICNEISGRQSQIYLRLNPEMEVPVKLYPWQYQSPKRYIEAFNHFARICKKNNPAIRIVWGASGYPGAEEYWPGPDLADYTSIVLNGKSEAIATAFPIEKNPETLIRRKIIRMRFSSKPILILNYGAAEKDLISLKTKIIEAALKIDKEKDVIYSSIPNVPISPNTSLYRQTKVVAGVYDPKLLLVKSPDVDVEHIFIDLESIQNGTFVREFNAIIHRKHAAIVTVEPWRDLKKRGTENVLINTINGVYDEEFNKLYKTISNTGQTVYLRFAHEMEIPIQRYAWQSQDPALYISAFRYFMNLDKIKATNIRKVWGPAGDRGSIEFYPGNDVVDYVSIAIYGLPDKNITDVNQQESFKDIFNRKSYRMRFINKPIFITEFGVKGPEQYQQKWMSNASETIKSHKEIHGVCYFNLADNPKVWGNIPPPDWGISKTTYELFVRSIDNDWR